jgi:hypothetical protein
MVEFISITGTSQPLGPTKGLPKMLIVGIVAAVVVIAAAAGAIMLLSGGGDADDDDKGKGNGKYTMKNGDFIEYRITNADDIDTDVMNYRWAVSNVTSSGYDVLTTMIGGGYSIDIEAHYDSTDDPLIGGFYMYITDDWLDTFYTGVTVKDETIDTPLGSKAVKHYHVAVEDEDDDSLVDHVDIYVGKSNGVLYKWVSVEKENGVVISTSTFEIYDSNIAMIGSNVGNDGPDGDYLDYGLSVGDYFTYVSTVEQDLGYDYDEFDGPSLKWEVESVTSSKLTIKVTETDDVSGANSHLYYPNQHPVILGAYWSDLHTLADNYLSGAENAGEDVVMIGGIEHDVVCWERTFMSSGDSFETTSYEYYVGQVGDNYVLYQVSVTIATMDGEYPSTETTTFTLSDTNVDGVL